ncbi:MAG: 1-acyl-sn-glycerol-3-phosphate acyltransferase [Clostridia bacterium]|nr:1-acyl-sn-glycerol-3-phosphate acyltransferase [Clostridia bacterium]
MKIKTKKSSWEEIESLGKLPHLKPIKPPFLFRLLVRALSVPDLMKAHFSFTRSRMDQAGEGPWLILMNHSSFLDLKMASKILFPKPYQIVSTTDAFVGKSLLMRLIGCIPTQKFVTDVSLVMTLIRRLKKDKVSVLMYPEAGYSFDGTATRLPRRLGGLLKRLGVPVVLIRSDAGGFLRDPLYNGLRLRRVKVNATVSCLLTCEEIREKSVEELDGILDEAFSFDHFREQREKGIAITEGTRATGLERVLYRCPRCGAENRCAERGSP